MNQQEIRVALVGCGGMAKRYRRTYTRLPGVRWIVAIDPLPDVLQACQAEGAERCSTRFEDALADDINAVIISTPNHLHADQAVAALQAGKHVMLQKPIANTLDAADRIVKAADEAHRRFGVWAAMYMHRYEDPVTWAMKAILDAGLLGTVQSVRARDAHRGGLAVKDGSWRSSKELTGGGSFMQLSIHSLNLITWLLGTRVESVKAVTQKRICKEIGGDDCAAAIVTFADGTLGVFESGYASEGNDRAIYGTRGWMRQSGNDDSPSFELCLDQPLDLSPVLKYERAKTVASFRIPVSAYDDVSNPYNQHVVFINRIRRNEPPQMSVAQGRDDLAVVTTVQNVGQQSGTAVDRMQKSPIES